MKDVELELLEQGPRSQSIPTKQELYAALEQRHGKARQEKFKQARVAICGLGGLGSAIAIMLARAGIGQLHLIDFDAVDISNLNRQQYFISQIGKPKTEALKENLLQISPYLTIHTDYVKITTENVKELLEKADVICEAFDRADQKAMLVEQVLMHFPEKYLIAGSGMAGFGLADTIKTRKVTEHFYLCGDGECDVEDGVGLVSSRVMVCAAHQAHMVLRLLAGEEK